MEMSKAMGKVIEGLKMFEKRTAKEADEQMICLVKKGNEFNFAMLGQFVDLKTLMYAGISRNNEFLNVVIEAIIQHGKDKKEGDDFAKDILNNL